MKLSGLTSVYQYECYRKVTMLSYIKQSQIDITYVTLYVKLLRKSKANFLTLWTGSYILLSIQLTYMYSSVETMHYL